MGSVAGVAGGLAGSHQGWSEAEGAGNVWPKAFIVVSLGRNNVSQTKQDWN